MKIHFTHSERAVLGALVGNARRVMSRSQLLDAIAGPGSDSTDRSIDFVINRLRAKLGDQARAPSFIATRYGEGYVWIAGPTLG
ncbi:DNA-binding response OmpR family regulator [Ancylobacter sp. 3268]|uniref:winged helix-turn-helix domain-containing protein n=1 Tax=Ancylobacter sp. 3268 TaxID=2817752 RepID=UPI00286730EE|nr:helix-turn-helix domain-containing protein [Ancylobacter sp. 3268]MDR6952925.1 DNA-binding response OmpR family regulator [Ancylobacter sp. 3268]